MYHPPAFEPTRDEMMSILEKHIPFLNRMELVPIWEADGRTVSEDLTAPYSLPGQDASACDGIAVRFADFAAGLPDTSDWTEGREFVYSNTGVAIPEEFDTVIPIEEVKKYGKEISICTAPKRKGEEIQPAGSLMMKGEILARRGETLTPDALGSLLSAGFQSVPVFAKPRVLFLPTGDELVPSGGQVPIGKNVESNSVMVYAMLKRFGCQAAVGGIVPDDPADLEAALLRGVRQADMVVIGAGSSKGSKDFTMDVLEKLGTVVVQELGVAPGKHCSLTFIGGVPVLGIPGPPGGARLICQYYLRAAIDLLTAGCRRESMRVSARLTADVPGRWIDFMQPVRLFWADGILWAEPSASFGRTRAAARQPMPRILYCLKEKGFLAGETVSVELPYQLMDRAGTDNEGVSKYHSKEQFSE